MKRKTLGAASATKDGDDDDDDEDADKEMKAAYKEYMAEVISALVFYANPDAEMTSVVQAIDKVASLAMKFDHELFSVGLGLYSIFIIIQM